MMHTVRGLSGGEKRISRLLLEELRMLMDWQLRQLGYNDQSVTLACSQADDREEYGRQYGK